MDITVALVFVNGTSIARIECDKLVALGLDDSASGELLSTHRRILESAFSEIYDTTDVDVLFPELGECVI